MPVRVDGAPHEAAEVFQWRHLFVRATGRVAGRRSAPFVYCGDVGFEDWGGERPITVRWRLAEAAPGR